jgi:hypothetical protein
MILIRSISEIQVDQGLCSKLLSSDLLSWLQPALQDDKHAEACLGLTENLLIGSESDRELVARSGFFGEIY